MDSETIELLKLCDFTPQEIRTILPRLEKAFSKLQLTSEDIERGKRRIVQYFAPELKGMRRTVGVSIRELVDIVLSKEEGGKKFIYAAPPTVASDLMDAAMYYSEDVVAAMPDPLICLTLGSVFGKLDHILNAAEKHCLRDGAAHCSLLQIRLGLYLLDMIPKADLMCSMGSICEAGPKVDEQLYEFFGIPVQYINACQDRGKELSDLYRQAKFFFDDIRRYRKRLGELLGFEITDPMLAEARKARGECALTMHKIYDMILTNDPPPLSISCLQFLRALRSMPIRRRNLLLLTEAANILYKELEQRVSKGIGIVEKGAPRIYYGLASLSDPSIINLVEDLGIVIALSQDLTFEPDGELKANLDKVIDKGIVEKIGYSFLQNGLNTCIQMKISSSVGALKRNNLDGALWIIHRACRDSAGDALMVKDAVLQQVGIPAMVIEGDSFDPRFYSVEQLRTRIEAFAEIVKSFKLTMG